ncbi:MAG TPA: 23S rRNA (adenine(2503)-C(2))-methyltransferase RlmN [Gemmatales bacterium]|nr:23S rRNA (adenine(2503)-C(2))-methyltransferase RlmN [Gemmatales bacterium]
MKTELPQAIDTLPEAAPTLQPLLQLTAKELSRWLKDRGFQPWYSKAIRRWVLFKRATTFEQMSDLPKQLRTQLTKHFIPLKSTPAKSLHAHDGTRKLLLKMWDGEDIECVMIPDYDRRTACMSTQVGCGMGCVFCASGLNGVMRNLEPGEILEQLVLLRNLLPAEERLSHIVVMGMGEPLANLDNLLTALEDATAKDGLGIGARHVTISTVGLPVKIRRLAESGKQYSLAVSLHAPNEELRNKIVPTNDKTGLQNIMQAADDYFKRTGRQVTFEYVVLRDINDRPLEADQLSTLLKGRGAHVNLIPFNEVDGLPYRRPTDERLNRFVEILRENGINVHVRKRKGSEISAACGQLRRQAKAEAGTPLPAGEKGAC